jgi:hypothetical protein
MQTISFLRVVVPLVGAGLMAFTSMTGCSPRVDNPYATIKDAPLVRATPHTVTLVGSDAALVDRLRQDGYAPMPSVPNYPGSVRVQASLWKVPETVASAPVVLLAPAGRGLNIRLLAALPAEPAEPAEPAVLEAFYRNVLGSDLPQWPGAFSLPSAARVQVWTFLIDDVLAARRRLREAGIPITFDAVAITTAYLGDHKLLGIVAPDGVIVELVETTAQ